MKTMKISLGILAVILLTNCGMKRHQTNENDMASEEMPKTTKVVKVKAQIGEMGQETDPLTITAVEVRGNLLYIDVEYTGGCIEHEFEVTGSQNILKSLPPIRSIELIHRNMSDECKSIQKRKLEVDITDLAYMKEKGSEIHFTLAGWKEKIIYKYC